jgi:hypothetical protein
MNLTASVSCGHADLPKGHDVDAKRIGSWSFQTGWRINLVGATFEAASPITGDVVVLHMSRGSDVAREYFAINNDQLRLVRIENDRGESIHNAYVFPNYEIGLVPHATTVDEWFAVLGSENTVEVTSALLFLGGTHVDGTDRTLKLQHGYADAVQQMLGTGRMREVIERLRNSKNEWVSQAAMLAERRARDPFFR